MDTTIYLDYLTARFRKAGGEIHANVHFEKLEDVDETFDLVINCAGIGARELVHDADLEPHRGQVAIVPKIEGLSCAIVCDDAPLMYAIPRANDCVFGGTNDVSDNLAADPQRLRKLSPNAAAFWISRDHAFSPSASASALFENQACASNAIAYADGRTVIHNYGHGGAGFTLSWGCAREVLEVAVSSR